MITLKQEMAVRSIIGNPFSLATDRDIAKSTGVSHWQVLYQRRLLRDIGEIPSDKALKIRDLILAGMPLGAIVTSAKATHKEVKVVRRFYYLKRRESGGHSSMMCPTCGAVMSSKAAPDVIPPKSQHLASSELACIPESEALALYRVVLDIHQLNGAHIISSPLFYHLAEKAKKILDSINKLQRSPG